MSKKTTTPDPFWGLPVEALNSASGFTQEALAMMANASSDPGGTNSGTRGLSPTQLSEVKTWMGPPFNMTQSQAVANVLSASSSSSSSTAAPRFIPPYADTTNKPSLAELVLEAAMQSSSGYAYTGSLPRWVPDKAQNQAQAYGSKSPSIMVYFGDAPTKKVTVAAGPDTSHAGGAQMDATGTTKVHANGDKVQTIGQAVNDPYTWSQQQYDQAVAQMKAAGMDVSSFQSVVKNWQALTYRAGMTYTLSGGSTKMTPWDALDQAKAQYQQQASVPGSANYTGSVTQTSKNVTDITEGQAWSALQTTLSSMLGRDPNSQEMRDFVYRMNNLASKNPSVTTTVQQYKNGQPTTQSSTTDPGFTSSDMAMKAYSQAQNNPDYAEYQAATTYFNALQSALAPIGG